MYLPPHFVPADRAAACKLIEAFDFGLLISSGQKCTGHGRSDKSPAGKWLGNDSGAEPLDGFPKIIHGKCCNEIN